MSMTPEDLDAIRKRAEAATPGPWALIGDTVYFLKRMPPTGKEWACFHGDIPTAEFVVYSRTDIPALIAEVERLREDVARLEEFRNAVRYEDLGG